MTYFIVLIAIAGVLTFLCVRVQMLLFRLAASMGWLACLIYLLVSGNTSLGISDTWNQVVGFIFVVMAFGTLLLQIKTETKRNKTVIDNYGRRHVETSTDWAPKKRNKKPSSEDRQAAYKMKVRSAADRGRQRARGG